MEKGKNNKKEMFLSNYMYKDARNFKIVHARTYYAGDLFAEFNAIWAQITLKFTIGKNIDKYIVFERVLENDLTYLDWKVVSLDYELNLI